MPVYLENRWVISLQSSDENGRPKKVGENVIGEPVMIPGVGTYVSFKDTEGNILSILKPMMARWVVYAVIFH